MGIKQGSACLIQSFTRVMISIPKAPFCVESQLVWEKIVLLELAYQGGALD
jgi:hypothetical protein